MSGTGWCRNCGAPATRAYCSECGQATNLRIPSLREVLLDALGDLYNFDSRLWRSLIALSFRPGRITREYLEGRRARYVPPFRMYIVTSVVFFLLVSLQGGEPRIVVAGLEAPPEVPLLPAGEPAEIPGAGGARVVSPGQDEATSTAGAEQSAEQSAWTCDFDGSSSALRARVEKACEQIRRDSGASFARAFTENVPLMMLIFIPVVAGLMKALYPLSGRRYVEHLLFFLHVHTLFFVLAIVVMLLDGAASIVPPVGRLAQLANVGVWLYFPAYLFMAMRHVYGQGRGATALKLGLLSAGYFVALSLTLVGTTLYTALTL